MKKQIFFLASLLFSISLFAQAMFNYTYEFTNCEQEGNIGPDQSQVNNEYSGTSLEGQVLSNEGIQEWVVPHSGLYTVDVFGAEGEEANSQITKNGDGAMMYGQFIFSDGDEIKIFVGQQVSRYEYDRAGGGEYTKQIDLSKNAKRIYFLELETNDGVINKEVEIAIN